jgi:hypothetical protein
MAVKIPIVYDDAGGLQQLQSGDTIGSSVVAEFPDWTNTGNQWPETNNALLDSFDANYRLKGSKSTTFGSIVSGSGKWRGGVLAPTGNIYGVPHDSTTILKINTSNDTVSTFGSLSGSSKWWGGVLAPSSIIYGIPLTSTEVLIIDPSDDTTNTFASLSGTSKWSGGVVSNEGFIYGIPFSSTSVLKIDPTNNTTSVFGSLSGSSKWIGGCLGPDGCIYGIPYASQSILKIDTSDDSTSLIPLGTSSTTKCRGGVLGAHGIIYFIPYGLTFVWALDTSDGTFTRVTLPTTGDSNQWAGGCLAPDGTIHSSLFNSSYSLAVDTLSEVVTIGKTLLGASNTLYEDTVLALNGHMYGIPYSSTDVFKLKTNFGPISANFCLSRYFNKL